MEPWWVPAGVNEGRTPTDLPVRQAYYWPKVDGELQRQLASVHGLKFVPTVVDGCYRDWGDDPFGGSWNAWHMGVKSWKVKHHIINPVSAVPLFICGKATSDAQGWVVLHTYAINAMVCKKS